MADIFDVIAEELAIVKTERNTMMGENFANASEEGQLEVGTLCPSQ